MSASAIQDVIGTMAGSGVPRLTGLAFEMLRELKAMRTCLDKAREDPEPVVHTVRIEPCSCIMCGADLGHDAFMDDHVGASGSGGEHRRVRLELCPECAERLSEIIRSDFPGESEVDGPSHPTGSARPSC